MINTRTQHFSLHRTWPVLLASWLMVPAVIAQNGEQFSVSGALDLGGEYNSNVSVTELESATGASDTALAVDANIDLNWRPADRVTVDVGYGHTASRYSEFDDFDLSMHLLYGDMSYQFDQFSLGTNYYLADARLGGDAFLTMQQLSFYGGKLFGDSFFLRGALNFTDKDFDTLNERDADGQGLRVDAFWFFNQGRSSIALAYSYDDEDALAQRYAYDASTLRLRYSNRFSIVDLDSRLQLGLRAQDRSYKGVTPEIAARRNDDQLVAEARFDIAFTEHLGVFSKLERGVYSSNLDSADYTENRVMLGARFSF